MYLKPPTREAIIKEFNTVLKGITDEKLVRVPTCTGLDRQTTDVLNLLAQQPNPKRPADIRACRIEFARQLDGTHAREDYEEEEAFWDSVRRGMRG